MIERFYGCESQRFSRVRGRVQIVDDLVEELGLTVAVLQETPLIRPDEWPLQWRAAEEIRVGRCPLGAEFSAALTAFERRLPLRRSSELVRADLAGRLHAACGGDLGVLWLWLVRLATEALAHRVERLDHAFIDRIENEDRKAETVLRGCDPFAE